MTQMKRLLFCLLLLTGFTATAQVYNNEWIDHSKTYYKFKVGKNGLFRVPQTTLATAGLGSVPAEQFQLWRNGVEVPIYTSVASGTLSGSDFIEFWGELNDGKPDKGLYRKPEFQLNDKWSLQTDSSTYFLTVNTGTNLRLIPTTNNIAGNTLPAEPYFMYTAGQYFRDRINNGRAVDVGDNMYSSSYDFGEGWSSGDIWVNNTHSFTFNNLFVYSGGGQARFTIAVSGNRDHNQRRYIARINNDSIVGNSFIAFDYRRDTATFNSSLLSTSSAAVTVTNLTDAANDRMVVHQYELTYPRQFNFGGAANFEFVLPASAAGNYLEISGFSFGGTQPVLYDLTNGKRYVCDVSTPSMVKIVLGASVSERRLVLASAEASNVSGIATLQARNFVDYRLPQNQGDYLIISNPLLFNGPSGTNPVEEYRQYRSSSNGGSYNAKTYLADDLVDQFAFGIKKHPAGIRNFIMFARNNFSVAPKHVLLLGKGVNYIHQRIYESNPDIQKLNLVPTFGWPASDILLAADPGDSYPKTSVGRLSVINGQEVLVYLNKLKEYETAQKTMSPFIKDKAWMKNVVHAVGSSEPGLQLLLDTYMKNYKGIISDTLFGGNVNTFTKTSASSIQQINSGQLNNLFEEGISLFTYFGHSSASTFEFNLNIPEQYNNKGKYPLFIALGCNAGNFYNFNGSRFLTLETLSERFNLTPDHGTIGFIASSHFGIVHYLDLYNTRFYRSVSFKDYGKSVGETMQSTIAQLFAYTTQEDFYARATAEETSFHGDPAVKVNTHDKPDYVIEDQLLRLSPNFVSVADKEFKVNAQFMNIGRATTDSIVVQVKREFPDRSTKVVFRNTLPAIRYIDSISVIVPIDPIKDKGTNKITVEIDPDNIMEELFETNNSITKEIVVFEDEARPIYPQNFSIINKSNIKFIVSTANPFSSSKTYRMEIDTTELFNSPLKATVSKAQVGGIIEFEPSISYTNNTVYYWRTGIVLPNGVVANWSSASFVYLNNHDLGFNQSHVYQHFKSTNENLHIDSSSRKWNFNPITHDITAKNTVFGYGGTQEGIFSVAVDGSTYIRSACVGSSLIFNVFDAKSLQPWKNVDANGNSLYQYGSGSASCTPTRNWNFEYSYMSPESRKRMMDFMDIIPEGSYVVVRSIDAPAHGSFSSTWRADTALYGSGNSLYHKLLQAGFTDIDSLNRQRSWIMIYQKGNRNIQPKFIVSEGLYDQISLSADGIVPANNGNIISPAFGPAKTWKEFQWNGSSVDNTLTDEPKVDIYGIKTDGSKKLLVEKIGLTQQQVDISNIDANTYPYLELNLTNKDTSNYTPYQLDYWRLTYTPVPEGALAPNIFLNLKDTFDMGEPFNFNIAFKNISDEHFDSVKVKVVITDKNNAAQVFSQKYKPLVAGDTLTVRLASAIDTKRFEGYNTLFVDVNPDNDQPEQYHFNNFIYRNFYVISDSIGPLLDVTFDNVHILNRDIVSSKPDIVIKLQDEAKWNLIDDTSLVQMQVIDPDGITKNYFYNNDTLIFTPAQAGSNQNNTAVVNFRPYFEKDGFYQLIVTGKDKSENQAGAINYKVDFEVINKPMISNLLNYPNPFTTSTAFVFTVTGSEVPQNIKIQILTVTGKVVREITKNELGPLHIGRNITEFKWDGTDQYGQKLANGVYLYRVVTNLNGKALDKYASENDKTDKFFNKGYGKMYLMR
jgi:hypothetical protein